MSSQLPAGDGDKGLSAEARLAGSSFSQPPAPSAQPRRRIGVFVCWCGVNIGGVVDVERVAAEAAKLRGVAHATHYRYMCSEPGQHLIQTAIADHRLDGVVVAACSPRMHETTFRSTVVAAGLNPYACEVANVREQCSWVHRGEKELATEKAIAAVRAMIEKVRQDEPLEALRIPVTPKALVIGGGIAGMQAALDIANAGREVVLVERLPSIGGHMAQLAETFPTLDCSQCILTPRMVEVGQHRRIKLITHAEVESVSGYVGSFVVRIRRRPTYVDWEKCTGCGLCQERCPTKVPASFDRGLGQRKAIYTLSPQAVPNKPTIDAEHCLYFQKGVCRVCQRQCPVGAVDFTQGETTFEETFGAIVVATGYETFPKDKLGEYGYGEHPDVIDGLAFERLLAASGPTTGEVRRPSDGKVPREVVFIQCVGSREPERDGRMPYCSRVCCMYTAKQATLYKHKVPDGQPYVFYMDVRAAGKGYEEFYRAAEEEGVLYLRGRVARVFPEGDQLVVWGVDTLGGKRVEIRADLVVLATAMVASPGSKELAQRLRIAADEHGFYTEAHPKLRPVESSTPGIYLAGCGQAPRDIADTVAHASGAAAKVIALFSRSELTQEPTVAWVDEEVCAGCGTCLTACPYEARRLDEARELDLRHQVAKVNAALCQGCGACVAACPNKACQLRNTSSSQVMAMIEALTGFTG